MWKLERRKEGEGLLLGRRVTFHNNIRQLCFWCFLSLSLHSPNIKTTCRGLVLTGLACFGEPPFQSCLVLATFLNFSEVVNHIVIEQIYAPVDHCPVRAPLFDDGLHFRPQGAHTVP